MANKALVTGASRGIGKAVAVALAEAGFDLDLAARTLRASDPTPEHSLEKCLYPDWRVKVDP